MKGLAVSAYYFLASIGCGVIAHHVTHGRIDLVTFIACAALWWGIRAWTHAQKGPTP